VILELLGLVAEGAADGDLRELASDHVRALHASEGGGDRGLVKRAEDTVQADSGEAFEFDSKGLVTLTAAGASWSAGRFETPSIGELRARVGTGNGGTRLWVFDGRVRRRARLGRA